jgi:hypothetical protein
MAFCRSSGGILQAAPASKNRIQQLALRERASYCRRMKQVFAFFLAWLLCSAAHLRAQDAALVERVNKLNGYVQDLLEDKANQKKQIESLGREIQGLREEMSKPAGNYASQDDLRRLADAIKEIDEKREADKKLILKEIENLGKLIASSPGGRAKGGGTPPDGPKAGGGAERGYEHTVAAGDTISTIALAYRERGVKVTVDQILKANPGLVPEKMQVGQKVWIPEPR